MPRFEDPVKAVKYLLRRKMKVGEIANAVPCGRQTIWRIRTGVHQVRPAIQERLKEMATEQYQEAKRGNSR